MYSINQINHIKYGNILEVTRVECSSFITPFSIYNEGARLRRLYLESNKGKIKFLVDGQSMTLAQFEAWSETEYKNLPKCHGCAKILNGQIFNHNLSNNIFCTQSCADKDQHFLIDKYSDQEDCEYL